jgi:hypothetical protein
MMSSSTKAQSKQLLGVHAALRSKKTLTPQTLLEMDAKPASRTVADLAAWSPMVTIPVGYDQPMLPPVLHPTERVNFWRYEI